VGNRRALLAGNTGPLRPPAEASPLDDLTTPLSPGVRNVRPDRHEGEGRAPPCAAAVLGTAGNNKNKDSLFGLIMVRGRLAA
jgi:hypothetical protein